MVEKGFLELFRNSGMERLGLILTDTLPVCLFMAEK
jgi:hypothetical protein